MQESLSGDAGAAAAVSVAARHFATALRCVRPSVSRADRVLYERLRDKLVASRSHIAPDAPPGPAAAAPSAAAAGAAAGTPAASGMEGVAEGAVGGADGEDPVPMAVDGEGGEGAGPMEM